MEKQLCDSLPKEMWTLASDVQILHGRRICRPKPLCDQCAVRDDCDYYRTVIAVESRPSTRVAAQPAKPTGVKKKAVADAAGGRGRLRTGRRPKR